jgi:hypothetical protein
MDEHYNKGIPVSDSDCVNPSFSRNYDYYRNLTSGRQHNLETDVPSIMVRGLDGSISFWNPGAELSYGWSKQQAVGSVSHSLLQTQFPYPIEQINQELLKNGVWEGALIHTMSDGSKVKVRSRWELQPNDQAQSYTVFEINRDFQRLEKPGLSAAEHACWQMIHTLKLIWKNKWWWLIPALIIYALLCLVLFFTEHFPIEPML